jgi:4-hydroxythreonine-4-phosphate dehydrogenase
MGDPAGIGPELCLRALASERVLACCVPLVFGDEGVLDRVADACDLALPSRRVPLSDVQSVATSGEPCIVTCKAVTAEDVRPGMIDPACGRAAYRYVVDGIQAVRSGLAAALTTAPINKASLAAAGIPYPGHTEILAAETGSEDVCMMLASDSICVSLVTTHVAYAEVPSRITAERLRRVIELTDQAMKAGGCPEPRLTVCGLNPHAGEEGLFGTEERDIIAPAVDDAVGRGILVEGPLPPDTAFVDAVRARTDAYIAMTHDQGLIPFKMLAFESGVNVTLGLPIVRTSPDHGTAFDIAWQGKASVSSLVAAIEWAAACVQREPRLCKDVEGGEDECT